MAFALEMMLHSHFVQQGFELSDPLAEETIYGGESMRRFVDVELGEDAVPDETTILRFRHPLGEHDLPRARTMFATANLYTARCQRFPRGAKCVL